MSKHTPGRWEAVTGRSSWGGPLPPRVIAGKEAIATVEGGGRLYTPDGGDVDERGMQDRDDANARLIAAAPELLAACERLLAAYAEYIEDESQLYPEAVLAVIVGEVMGAAAKAKGE